MNVPKKNGQSAFTIIELLIAVVIVGILATFSLVAYNGVQDNAASAVLKADLKQASTQLEIDRLSSGAYPASVAAANSNQGLKSSAGTTYQYTYEPGTGTYCLTATSDRAGVPMFNFSSEYGGIQEGPCDGHTGGGEEQGSPIAYETSFEALDFWEARPSTNSNVYMNDDEPGNRVLALYGGAGSMQVYADRDVSGLTVGAQYTISAQAAVEGAGGSPRTAYIGIDGIGLSNGVSVASSGGEFVYSPVLFSFTATSTTHTMILAADSVDEWGVRFNDVLLEGPASVEIYSHDFELDSSWTNITGFTTPTRTGIHALLSAAGSNQIMTRPTAGFDIGATYTFTVWVRNNPFWSATASIGVSGIGSTTGVSLTDTYQELSYEFTATATEHTLEMNNVSGQSLWDDVLVVRQ